MTGEGIFLTRGGELAVLTEQPYATEDVLQRALAEHPEVIAGPTTSDSKPGNLLLVRREMGVPDAGGSIAWSLDHLFLDAEGVPVVVEVKRSSDTRIRREVVGQMLDYAANGVKYWPVTDLRGAVDQAAAEAGKAGEDLVAALRPGLDPEEYWKTVEANLAAGRIRMLFVADKLPPELVRVIEFLNEQMNPAEVLGVELPRYAGSGNTVYVPRVVGRTSAAVGRKNIGAGQLWNEESFLDAARARRPEAEVALIQRLLADARSRGTKLTWGKGVTPGVTGWYPVGGQPSAVWNLNVNSESPTARAYLYFYLTDLVQKLPADTMEHAAQILESVGPLAPKVADARANGWKKYPSVYLADIAESSADITAIFDAIAALTDAS